MNGMSQGLLPCFVDSAKEESRGDNATAVAPLEPPLFQGENNPTVEVTGDYSPELFAIPFTTPRSHQFGCIPTRPS